MVSGPPEAPGQNRYLQQSRPHRRELGPGASKERQSDLSYREDGEVENRKWGRKGAGKERKVRWEGLESCSPGPQPPAGQVTLGKLLISSWIPISPSLCTLWEPWSGWRNRDSWQGRQRSELCKGGLAPNPGLPAPPGGGHTSATGIDGKSLSSPHVNDTN